MPPHIDLAGPQSAPFAGENSLLLSREQPIYSRPALLGRVIGPPAQKALIQP